MRSRIALPRLRAVYLGLATLSCVKPTPSSEPANSPPAASLPVDLADRAERIYREAIVVDTHNDMPGKLIDDGYNADIRNTTEEGHTDLPRLLESGMTAEFMVAWVDAPYATRSPDQSFERANVYLDTIHAFVRRHPSRLIYGTTTADVHRAKQEGKVAILIGVEGGHAIEASLGNLRVLYDRGARYMTLTWNNGNQWAGSSIGVGGTRTGGLTAFGRDVVREMNRIGMLVDLSHVSDSTFFDAIAISSDPVIASHSSARALNSHPRNLSDDQLRAIARNGGVVNVNFFSRFIDPRFRAAEEAMLRHLQLASDSLRIRYGADTAARNAELDRLRRTLRSRLAPTRLSVLIDHIDHLARVAGVDHVGLGSDFDGVSALPEGMEDVTRLRNITLALLERGYSEGDVKKILGGNMMRVMRQVLDRRAASQ